MSTKMDKKFIDWPAEIDRILEGIDRTELDDGWWETSYGVDFGVERLEEIKAFIADLLAAHGINPNEGGI